ncbi:MAG: hypothetical protein C4308_10945 [Chitinophagaceae bacterium]
MKTLKIFCLFIVSLAIASFSFAQERTDKFKVAGECGMCKKKIEKSAKQAGASYAAWNTKTKELVVKYNSTSTNTAKIQEAIAKTGYDTPGFKATDEAYNKLDACCQYDRTMLKDEKKEMSCCSQMKDGKCTDKAACKEKDCCKDMEKCKEKGCTGEDHKHDGAKGSCSEKDSKTGMNHSGAKCCSKKS